MAKSRQAKTDSLNDLSNNLSTAKSVVFANFQGLKVKEIEELRNKCRAENVYFVATKKTILAKALKDAGFTVDVKNFTGGVAAIFGLQDEVAPAQITAQFAVTHGVVKLFGGILEGNFIDSTKVNALALLPSKQQLLGQLVRTLNAPVSGFVNVLAGNLRGLVGVLNNIKEAKA